MCNESEKWAGMAIQGPQAAQVFARVFPAETLPPRNGIATLANGSIVCRTGYTGEDGFEFFCPATDGIAFWEKFIAAGAAPCGLGARDTLRLEMGFPLNGNDLAPDRTPIEAGLGFFCDLQKSAFTGCEILAQQKTDGPELKLTAIRCIDKSPPPRAHYPVLDSDGRTIGELSSGALSPSLSIGIGMAYLPAAYSKLGTRLQIQVRERTFPAEVVKKPFYRPTPTA
jgi:aminomethyltransferase